MSQEWGQGHRDGRKVPTNVSKEKLEKTETEMKGYV